MRNRYNVGFFLVLLLGQATSNVARAQGTVTPLVHCARYDTATNTLTAYFGYASTYTGPVTIGVGRQNFFSPGTLSRNQPTLYYPGVHNWVFQTSFPVSAGMPQVSWFLHGTVVTAKASLGLACDLPVNRGDWDPAQSYLANDLVKYLGSYWVVPTTVGTVTGVPPGSTLPDGSFPQLPVDPVLWLTALSKPGNPTIIPSSQVYTLPVHGSMTITDPNVIETSLIIAQYVGGRKDRPDISVDAVSPGRFTVSSLSGGDFRYLIFN